MTLLPDLPQSQRSTALSRRQERQAIEATAAAEFQAFRGALAVRVESQLEQLRAAALSDAARFSMREELDLLSEGLRLADGDPVRISIVVSRVDLLVSENNRRLRRFGV